MSQNKKRAAAEYAVQQVADGMVVGLGTGSTASLMVGALAHRVANGLRIVGIPTSDATEAQARALNIPITTFADYPQIDLTIDGADEVDGQLNLIKGLGGALLREKIVACASKVLIIIVDESKLVERLGLQAPVPVEVVRFGWEATVQHLRSLGESATLRLRPDGSPFRTDSGNYILDCKFGTELQSPHTLAASLDATTGVVEHGLFLGLTSQVVVGRSTGVEILTAANS
ncbi:MAG: ribose-5-phosphate isomerase RpiA [Acidobacteriota bacterium]